MGPVRHCGVLSVAQCRHFRPSEFATPPPSPPSFFFDEVVLTGFLPEWFWGGGWNGTTMSSSEDEVVGLRTRRREAQLHDAARDRLLLALAGTDISGWKIGLLLLSPLSMTLLIWLGRTGWKPRVSDDSSGRVFIPDISWSFCRSSLENDSSTKFDSHSSSTKSSYCSKRLKK